MLSNFHGLWIVATPLGNPGDLSPRARDMLVNADLVLCEDTRRTCRLMNEAGIAAKRLESFHDHNETQKLPAILKRLEAGATIALVSDAGTPLLSDPGYRLVRACRQMGIRVSPVPGPSALAAALSTAGIPPLPCSFLGFPPRRDKDRRELFASFRNIPGALVFFERKDRLATSLATAFEILGDREFVICREMTKTHEEFISGNLKTAAIPENLLGEITVVIGPGEVRPKMAIADVRDVLADELKAGNKPRSAARAAAKNCPGWSVDEIYNLMKEAERKSD